MIEHYPLISRLVTPLIAPSVHKLTAFDREGEGGSVLILSGLLTSSQWRHGKLAAVGLRLESDGDARDALKRLAPRGSAFLYAEEREGSNAVYLGAKELPVVYRVRGGVPGSDIMRDRELVLRGFLDVGDGYSFATCAFGLEDVFSVLLRPSEHRLRAFLSDVPIGASFFVPEGDFAEAPAPGPWRVAELLCNVCSCGECQRRRAG